MPYAIRDNVIRHLTKQGCANPTETLDWVLNALSDHSIGLFDMVDPDDPIEVDLCG